MNDIPTFSDLGIPENICAKLAGLGITQPTAVQQTVIPALQTRHHILFRSETGTGKTFAYLLPLLNQIDTTCRHPQLIIASPTYELASQIRLEIQRISDVPSILCIGNTSISRQIETLKKKPVIIVGNSARILELIYLKKIKTESVRALVLDEADQLFSKELRDSTVELVSHMPSSIQLIACSATVRDTLLQLISDSLPQGCTDRTVCTYFMPAEDILQSRIEHIALFSEQREKLDTVRKLLHALEPQRAVIFVSRAADIEKLGAYLRSKKINCAVLFAKADKTARKQAIDGFRSGKYPILITSDLSARGLDILGITHVIQMDMPSSSDVFIHRAGRTARAGKTGINLVIGTEQELRRYAALEKKLGITVYPRILYKGKLLAPVEIPAEHPEEQQE